MVVHCSKFVNLCINRQSSLMSLVSQFKHVIGRMAFADVRFASFDGFFLVSTLLYIRGSAHPGLSKENVLLLLLPLPQESLNMLYGLQGKILKKKFKVSGALISFFFVFCNPVLGKSSKEVSVTMLDTFQQSGKKIPTQILYLTSCHIK